MRQEDQVAQPAATWKLRLVAAAIGALTSAFLALALAMTLVGFYIGLVGIPVGAAVGAVFGPRLIGAERPADEVVKAGLVASALGIIAFGMAAALGEGRGASPLDLIAYAARMSLLVGVASLVYAAPMAMAAAAIATWWLRRAAGRVDLLWPMAAAVVLVVAAGTATALVRAVELGGDEAAMIGDEEAFGSRSVDGLEQLVTSSKRS